MRRHNDVYVIHEREESSMVSTWTVFLCITRGSEKPFRVFNGRYSEMLGCVEEYLNENTGNYRIPAKINGIKVEDVQDEWILGGDLKWYSNADTVECKDFADDSLLDWLTAHRWNAPEVLEKVRKTMRALVVTLKRRGPYFLCSMPGLDKLVLLSEFEVLQDGKCERASEGFRTKKEAKRAATLRRAESAYPPPFLDHYDTDSGTAWCWNRGVYSSEEYSSQEEAMDAWRKQTLVFTKLAD